MTRQSNPWDVGCNMMQLGNMKKSSKAKADVLAQLKISCGSVHKTDPEKQAGCQKDWPNNTYTDII
jgi:hypothetical protein